jgi:multimeric flavodoxin WrbA
MKVLGISGSMRNEGNTADLVNVILERCQSTGIKTEFISLAGKKIHPGLGCEKCKEKKSCVIENNDGEKIIDRVLDCDVLVIGSPTYYYDVCGPLKNFIDRTYSPYHDRRLAGRKGIAVAVQAHKGANRTIQTLEGFLSTHEFSSLGSVKGNGYHEGEVHADKEAVGKARKTGDTIVRLVNPHNH